MLSIILVAYLSSENCTAFSDTSAAPDAVANFAQIISRQTPHEEKGYHCLKRLDYCLLVHGRYFISLLPPNRKPIEAFPYPSSGDVPYRGYRLPLVYILTFKKFYQCSLKLIYQHIFLKLQYTLIIYCRNNL